ncbi:hypothetical protein [Pedobacter sandarakinus]|uniref:hypothetical protein n=1 Tax=Pedobacter sandarakinus TaxID=353156 RepID=UPI00224822B5|nr:hypothetical protein [Pedobacter sandarakinus]MCX2574206.1 hypothetical protein [Pedobacter sandarakinus]
MEHSGLLNENYNWHLSLSEHISALRLKCLLCLDGDFSLLKITDHPVWINLVSIGSAHTPMEMISFQEYYAIKGIQICHLWEDVWLTKPNQVLARITSLTGLNKRIHGRQTIVRKIDKKQASDFLNVHHLQGAVNSRYKLGLYFKDELVAVATFASLRNMNYSEKFRSSELIRFAVKSNYSVNGGLSKLIAFFVDLTKPDDLMTYADRDWSAGAAYFGLGFELTDILPPQRFTIDADLHRSRLIDSLNVTSVSNTGSLKFILRLTDV